MKNIKKLLQEKSKAFLDIGCGENKQRGFIGMDIRDREGVDIVHDVLKFPWPLPDECIDTAITSHLVEHIPPFYSDPRLVELIKILKNKKIIGQGSMLDDNYPLFMRFMDEAWRVVKFDGELAIIAPYGGSEGYWQDPTHCNGLNHMTWHYFDPLATLEGHYTNLYQIYKPKPWKIKINAYQKSGFMEVVLIKRKEDRTYKKHMPNNDD